MAGRARPHLRVLHRRLLVALAHDVTDRSRTSPALVIAPHPDDETIGAGATIARKSASGTAVRVVIAADSGDRTRRSECIEACVRLGLDPSDVKFLGFPDRDLSKHVPELRSELRTIVEDFHPDEVITPCPIDAHPDHRGCAQAVAGLGPELNGIEVLSYPIWYWNRWAWTGTSTTRTAQTAELLWRPAKHLAMVLPRIVRTEGFQSVKASALDAHRSQIDPSWGEGQRRVLDPEWLAMFLGTEELFFRERPQHGS
jgi:LmbE family N-acetylglucosaminyl deacetylase